MNSKIKNETAVAAKASVPAATVVPPAPVEPKPEPVKAPAKAPIAERVLAGCNAILAEAKVEGRFTKADEEIEVPVSPALSALFAKVTLQAKADGEGLTRVLWNVAYRDGATRTLRLGWVRANEKADKVSWHMEVVKVKAPSGVL